jgi:FkbM family methyltransferase
MLRQSVAFHTLTLSYYIGEFGIVRGVARFVADRMRHYLPAKGSIQKVGSPRHGDIYIRARTTDLAVFIQTFFHADADLTQLRQYPALKARYDDMRARGKLPIIIDGGGNIGTVSIMLAQIFPEAHVVTIEPDAANFDLACRNTARLPNVEMRRSALWSSSAIMRFATTPETCNADAISLAPVTDVKEAGQANVVAAMTIDDIMSEFETGELLLLKIDIEGAETEAIAPDAKWVKNTPVCIIEPHDWMIAGHASLSKLLSVPCFRDGDILIRGENLVFFPAT